MASVLSPEELHAAAVKHEKLCKSIAGSDSAKAELEKLNNDIATLKNQYYDASRAVPPKGSSLGSLFGGKKKREKALKKSIAAEKQLEDAKRKKAELEKVLDARLKYEEQLDALYASVFEAPGLPAPAPGSVEEKFQEFQKAKLSIQTNLSNTASAINHATMTLSCLRNALRKAKGALTEAEKGCVPMKTGILSLASDHIKRCKRELVWVSKNLAEALEHNETARKLDDSVPPLEKLEIFDYGPVEPDKPFDPSEPFVVPIAIYTPESQQAEIDKAKVLAENIIKLGYELELLIPKVVPVADKLQEKLTVLEGQRTATNKEFEMAKIAFRESRAAELRKHLTV